jgi:predicted nucleic acid-binding protein
LTVLYIDTSSLLKLLIPEPESAAVQAAVAAEDVVLLSVLTELEAEVQFRAGRLGGRLSRIQYRRLSERLAALKMREPFEPRSLPGSAFQTALRQHRTHATVHVRTTDRLHLAAMEELAVRRLMTHDVVQATAAQAMGYEVLSPGTGSRRPTPRG